MYEYGNKNIIIIINNISDIEVNSFMNLTECRRLSLTNNNLRHIKEGMFAGLTSLKQLFLVSNNISDIEVNSFMNLTECRRLSLSQNNLRHIKKGMLAGLPSLMKLSLNTNNIFQIEPGSFMTQLRFLSLNDNQLNSIGEDAFYSPMNLSLIPSNNPIQCDHRMCWIKEAEQGGRITLSYNRSGTFFHKPHCVNRQGVTWDDIVLDCDAKGKQFVLMEFCTNYFLTYDNECCQLWK